MKLSRTLAPWAAATALLALPALAGAATMMPGKDAQAAFQAAKITLAQAIATVEKQTGGKTTNAAFESMNGKNGYAVTVFANGAIQAMWVDPQSGAASNIDKPDSTEASIEALDKTEATTLTSAKASLPQAVSMAEQKAGGRAFDAGLQKHNAVVQIGVDVLKGGKLSTYWVDPAVGKLAT